MNQETNQILPPQADPEHEPQNLIQRFMKWATPPTFPGDEDLTRRAKILNNILLGAIAISFFYGLSLPFTSSSVLPVIGIIVVILTVLSLGLFNIRRGNVTTTSYLMVIFGWVMAAGTSLVFGGISGPVFSSFLVVTIAAGLVIGFRAALGVAAGSLTYGLILLILENYGVIQPFEGTSTSFFLRAVFNITVITYLIYLTIKNSFEVLREAEESKKALKATNMTLEDTHTRLGTAIEEITKQFERRNRYLEASAKVALNTNSLENLQDMLDKIVKEIAEQFGYYHVGVFLVEESGQWAVLQSVSSEGGRAMIERAHRLEVGKQGIVGFVTSIGQARITQDIQLDRIHSVTPELPETRSEMALPLKTRGEIVGALDIQDSVPNAFSDEDVFALQILADQIALAIENLRMAEQVNESLEEMQRVYGDYSRRAWAETHRQKALTAYKFSDGALTPILDVDVTIDSDNKVEIPIVVRGHKIGVVEIAREDPQSEWTLDEQELLENLSEQLGIALDSARLFNETQLRATTEQIIGTINAEIMESLEINSILRTTVEKLKNTLELPEVSIKMTAPASKQQPSSNGTPQDEDESN